MASERAKKRNSGTISIADIAKEAGVSRATVSRALNDSGYVKTEKKTQIVRLASKYSYVPNTIARGLRTGKTKTIAVIIPDINNDYYSSVVEGIEKSASSRGYDVLITCTFYDSEVEKKQIEKLKRKYVDGFLFVHGFYNDRLIGDLA
ncbi:MAG: LacI family transcriptional regulator, partial [Planctomycetaceae bacterium]